MAYDLNNQGVITQSLPSARMSSPLITAFTGSPRSGGKTGRINLQEGRASSREYEFKEGDCFGEIVSKEYNQK